VRVDGQKSHAVGELRCHGTPWSSHSGLITGESTLLASSPYFSLCLSAPRSMAGTPVLSGTRHCDGAAVGHVPPPPINPPPWDMGSPRESSPAHGKSICGFSWRDWWAWRAELLTGRLTRHGVAQLLGQPYHDLHLR
jgi:hypothetical protein